MPAPTWFFRFMYDRESSAWGRRRDEPSHRALVEATVARMAAAVEGFGLVADLGCGPGAHALALAERGYDVVGIDGSPRMVEVARTRATRDGSAARFEVGDVSEPLPFADGALCGALAVLVLQHLADPVGFLGEVRRCLRLGGPLLITAPVRAAVPPTKEGLYWRLRAAGYTRLPGVVRFCDEDELVVLLEASGFTVVERTGAPGRATVLARA